MLLEWKCPGFLGSRLISLFQHFGCLNINLNQIQPYWRRQHVPLKTSEDTYHSTWCKNPKYHHYSSPVFSQMTVKVHFSDLLLSTILTWIGNVQCSHYSKMDVQLYQKGTTIWDGHIFLCCEDVHTFLSCMSSSLKLDNITLINTGWLFHHFPESSRCHVTCRQIKAFYVIKPPCWGKQ